MSGFNFYAIIACTLYMPTKIFFLSRLRIFISNWSTNLAIRKSFKTWGLHFFAFTKLGVDVLMLRFTDFPYCTLLLPYLCICWFIVCMYYILNLGNQYLCKISSYAGMYIIVGISTSIFAKRRWDMSNPKCLD